MPEFLATLVNYFPILFTTQCFTTSKRKSPIQSTFPLDNSWIDFFFCTLIYINSPKAFHFVSNTIPIKSNAFNNLTFVCICVRAARVLKVIASLCKCVCVSFSKHLQLRSSVFSLALLIKYNITTDFWHNQIVYTLLRVDECLNKAIETDFDASAHSEIKTKKQMKIDDAIAKWLNVSFFSPTNNIDRSK